jgi:iron uptake system EfeUOB component EfeO/EfeM
MDDSLCFGAFFVLIRRLIFSENPPVKSEMKIPMGKQFQSGESGNPRGRPATTPARRHRALVRQLTELFGNDKPGPAEKAVIRQAALITMACEDMTTDYLNGAKPKTNDLVRMTNAATRLLEVIGIEKAKRVPTDTRTMAERIMAKQKAAMK